MTDYYKSSAEEMLWELSTSPTGLTSRQAQARQGKYEINKLKEAEKPGFLSLEARMGCGFGACMGCSCKTKYGNKRICKDGPVLEKEEIIW